MASTETDTITFYLSIVASMCLFVSETLPYVKAIKSNGIFHFIADNAKLFLQKPLQRRDESEDCECSGSSGSRQSSEGIISSHEANSNSIKLLVEDVDNKLDVILMRINEIKACQMYSDTISETLI
jgi:hypothetical protein